MYQDLEDEIWESLLKAAVIENSQNEIKDYSRRKTKTQVLKGASWV